MATKVKFWTWRESELELKLEEKLDNGFRIEHLEADGLTPDGQERLWKCIMTKPGAP